MNYQDITIKRRPPARAVTARAKAVRIAELYNDGLEARDISEAADIPLSTVYYYLQRLPDAE